MNADNIFRRLRGAFGNAVVWGAAWSALGTAVFATLKVAGILPQGVSWLDAIMIAGRLGILGGIAGAAFSAVIGLLYGGRRLSDISALRFGVRGGIVAGLFVPVFFQTMNLLSGGWVPMTFIWDDILLATLFGGVAAGASLKLAQRAQTMLSLGSRDQPDLLGSGDLVASAGAWDTRRRNAPAWRSAGD